MMIEGISLSLATAPLLRAAGLSHRKVLSALAVLAGLFALGAAGLAALLYLVTEELLVEAHEVPEVETPLVTAMFFVGFLLFLLLGMLS